MTYVRYIDKTREYYRGQGYETPYRWAHFEDTPFTPLGKPLAQCQVGLITTSEIAIVDQPDTWDEDDGARDVYALPMDTPVDKLVGRKEAYDRHATTLADVDSYLPLTHLRALVAEGRLGSLAPRFQVIYSQYSQRKTMTVDAPDILRQMREDGVDVALLTAI